MHEESPSLACENVLPSALKHAHVSTFCSQPSSSPEYAYDVPIDNYENCDSSVDMGYADRMFHMLGGNVETFESIGTFSGYSATLDPYCMNLVDKPRNILWYTFFVFSFDFSMAFSLMNRALTFFVLVLCVLSFYQAWKPFAEEFDKLLRALIAFECQAWVLKKRWSG